MAKSKNVPEVSPNQAKSETRRLTANLLAEGYSINETARIVGISEKTIDRWLGGDMEFSREVDRLTLELGIAAKAERLRMAKRFVRQRIAKTGRIRSRYDILKWLEFAQSETTGAKFQVEGSLNLDNVNDALEKEWSRRSKPTKG